MVRPTTGPTPLETSHILALLLIPKTTLSIFPLSTCFHMDQWVRAMNFFSSVPGFLYIGKVSSSSQFCSLPRRRIVLTFPPCRLQASLLIFCLPPLPPPQAFRRQFVYLLPVNIVFLLFLFSLIRTHFLLFSVPLAL